MDEIQGKKRVLEPENVVTSIKRQKKSNFHFLDFSDCVLTMFFRYLDAYDLYALNFTCKRFKYLIKERKLWQNVDVRQNPMCGRKFKFFYRHINDNTKKLMVTGVNNDEKCISSFQCQRLERISKNLTVLAIEYQFINSSEVLLKDFPASLKELSLEGTQVIGHKNFFLGASDKFTQLHTLVLNECSWVKEHSLMALSKFLALENLSLYNCENLNDSVAYMSITTRFGFKNLLRIDARRTKIGDQFLKCLNNLKTLREIYLEAPPKKKTTSNNTKTSTELSIISDGAGRACLGLRQRFRPRRYGHLQNRDSNYCTQEFRKCNKLDCSFRPENNSNNDFHQASTSSGLKHTNNKDKYVTCDCSCHRFEIRNKSCDCDCHKLSTCQYCQCGIWTKCSFPANTSRKSCQKCKQSHTINRENWEPGWRDTTARQIEYEENQQNARDILENNLFHNNPDRNLHVINVHLPQNNSNSRYINNEQLERMIRNFTEYNQRTRTIYVQQNEENVLENPFAEVINSRRRSDVIVVSPFEDMRRLQARNGETNDPDPPVAVVPTEPSPSTSSNNATSSPLGQSNENKNIKDECNRLQLNNGNSNHCRQSIAIVPNDSSPSTSSNNISSNSEQSITIKNSFLIENEACTSQKSDNSESLFSNSESDSEDDLKIDNFDSSTIQNGSEEINNQSDNYSMFISDDEDQEDDPREILFNITERVEFRTRDQEQESWQYHNMNVSDEGVRWFATSDPTAEDITGQDSILFKKPVSIKCTCGKSSSDKKESNNIAVNGLNEAWNQPGPSGINKHKYSPKNYKKKPSEPSNNNEVTVPSNNGQHNENNAESRVLQLQTDTLYIRLESLSGNENNSETSSGNSTISGTSSEESNATSSRNESSTSESIQNITEPVPSTSKDATTLRNFVNNPEKNEVKVSGSNQDVKEPIPSTSNSFIDKLMGSQCLKNTRETMKNIFTGPPQASTSKASSSKTLESNSETTSRSDKTEEFETRFYAESSNVNFINELDQLERQDRRRYNTENNEQRSRLRMVDVGQMINQAINNMNIIVGDDLPEMERYLDVNQIEVQINDVNARNNDNRQMRVVIERFHPGVQIIVNNNNFQQNPTRLKVFVARGYMRLTNRALRSLSGIRLELLDVTGTSVTAEGIKEFLLVNPDCRVIHESMCQCNPEE